jgi:hypothetical protein
MVDGVVYLIKCKVNHHHNEYIHIRVHSDLDDESKPELTFVLPGKTLENCLHI